MSFLPIVERELRVATRRKSTYRIRFITASTAIVLSVAFLIMASSATAGRLLFHLLTISALTICLLSGIFLTADCISHERREGTLGFLFLTDLKGYDVVFGKFIAESLNVFLSLLALLPVIAVSLLLGGVTGAEFWRVAIALVNALFFSLTLGIFMSSRGSDSHRTMGNTLLGLIGFTGLAVGAALARKFAMLDQLLFLASFSPVDPFLYAHASAYARAPESFWFGLVGSHSLVWIFLAMTSRSLPAYLDEEDPIWNKKSRSFLRMISTPLASERRKREAKLARNPVFWLATRSALTQRSAWAFAICGVALFFIGTTNHGAGSELALGYVAFLFLFKVCFALQACWFFVEARRSNALEQICTTPLSETDIVDGQWLALQKVFLLPSLLLMMGPFISGLLVEHPDPRVKAMVFYTVLQLLADLFALGWVGMWFALSLKRPIFAGGLTILYVLLLPLLTIFCGLNIVIDLALAAWARKNVLKNIRELAVT